MERWYYANKQCSWREYIEISGIPASLVHNGLKSKVFEVLKEISIPIDPSLVENCHRLPYKSLPKKVIIELNRRKDIRWILLNKNKLKKLKPEPVNLPGETNVFINESLCFHYKKTVIKMEKFVGRWWHFRVLCHKRIAENQAAQWICVHNHKRFLLEKAVFRKSIDWR